MAWSLGYLPPREPELLDDFFLAAGKCLYLANAFEKKCRWLLRFAELAHYLKDSGDFDASLDLVNAIKNKMLHATIGDLKKFAPFKPEDLVLLERARDARNFIAHEGAALGHLSSVSAEQVHEKLAHLRREVEALALGDNLVSCWLYEIEEKEPAPAAIKEAYPRWVDQWVFGGIDGT
jgi:hypothetical protein